MNSINQSPAKNNAKNDPADGQLGWRDLPIGGVLPQAGNSVKYSTGNWNPGYILWDESKCKQCGLCYPVCPEGVILHKNGKMVGIDADHCKKCGICVLTCPFKALSYNQTC